MYKETLLCVHTSRWAVALVLLATRSRHMSQQDDEAYYSDDFELEESEEIVGRRLSPDKHTRRPPSRLAVPPTPPHLVRPLSPSLTRALATRCSDGLSGGVCVYHRASRPGRARRLLAATWAMASAKG